MNLASTAELLRLNKRSYKTFSKTPALGEQMERVSCPICGQSTVNLLWECGDFRFSQCVGCGHVYQNPRPRAGDLLDRYDEEYKEYEVENSQNFFNLMRYGLRDAGIFSLTNQMHNTRSRTPMKALDIGCATGVLVKYLKDMGWESHGLEVCLPAAEYGMNHRGVHIYTQPLESADISDESYDLIHFSHVIEHLSDVNEFLHQVRRICKPGGWVVITTPNRSSIQAAVMGAQWRSAIADHTHLFNAREIRGLLCRHGFRPEKQKTWGGIPVGMAGPRIKAIVDRFARLTGMGDVVMVAAQRLS